MFVLLKLIIIIIINRLDWPFTDGRNTLHSKKTSYWNHSDFWL